MMTDPYYDKVCLEMFDIMGLATCYCSWPYSADSIALWNRTLRGEQGYGRGSAKRCDKGDTAADEAIASFTIHIEEAKTFNDHMGCSLYDRLAPFRRTEVIDLSNMDLDMFAFDPFAVPIPTIPDVEAGDCYWNPKPHAKHDADATDCYFCNFFKSDHKTSTAVVAFDSHVGLKKDWPACGFEFQYDLCGGLQSLLTARQLDVFINQRDGSNKLRILLQRNLAAEDTSGPLCMCVECPTHRLSKYDITGAGVIQPGDFMLAFDEFVNAREKGLNISPLAVSGHMHMYCAERFLRFPHGFATFIRKGAGYCNDDPCLEFYPDESLTQEEVQAVEEFRQAIVGPFHRGVGFRATYPSRYDHAGSIGRFTGTLTHLLNELDLVDKHPSASVNYVDTDTEGQTRHVHRGDLEVYTAGMMMQHGSSHGLTFLQRDLLSTARKPYLRRP